MTKQSNNATIMYACKERVFNIHGILRHTYNTTTRKFEIRGTSPRLDMPDIIELGKLTQKEYDDFLKETQ